MFRNINVLKYVLPILSILLSLIIIGTCSSAELSYNFDIQNNQINYSMFEQEKNSTPLEYNLEPEIKTKPTKPVIVKSSYSYKKSNKTTQKRLGFFRR